MCGWRECFGMIRSSSLWLRSYNFATVPSYGFVLFIRALRICAQTTTRAVHAWYFSWFSVLILSRCSSVSVVFSLRKLFLIKRRRKTLVSDRKSCRLGIGCCSRFHLAFVSTQRCHLFFSDKYLLCLRKLTPFVRISQGERKAREFGCFHRGARQLRQIIRFVFFHRWQVFCRRHEFLLFVRLLSHWVCCKTVYVEIQCVAYIIVSHYGRHWQTLWVRSHTEYCDVRLSLPEPTLGVYVSYFRFYACTEAKMCGRFCYVNSVHTIWVICGFIRVT